MLNRWAGPLITTFILGGVALVVVLNLNWQAPIPTSKETAPRIEPPTTVPIPSLAPRAGSAGFREYPIGDEVIRNEMRLSAVWLPPVEMEGMAAVGASSDVIHLEADVRAVEGNRNGFAKDEFVPYLKIRYKVLPTGTAGAGAAPIHQGELMPMVARDGLHYGASLAMPKPGAYRLVYDVEPPSAGGLGRHSDPITGVAPWWKPFQVEYDWDYPGMGNGR